MLCNYYDLLKVGYDATQEDIIKAYREKMRLCQDEIMEEKYRTAYYNLSNARRRHKYDISLGIHKYKKVSCFKRVIKVFFRAILTILDALLSFWWCFVCASIIAAVICDYYINKNFDLIRICIKYSDESKILFLCSLLDLTLHFYVRRANRYLKNQKWEVSNEYDK